MNGVCCWCGFFFFKEEAEWGCVFGEWSPVLCVRNVGEEVRGGQRGWGVGWGGGGAEFMGAPKRLGAGVVEEGAEVMGAPERLGAGEGEGVAVGVGGPDRKRVV